MTKEEKKKLNVDVQVVEKEQGIWLLSPWDTKHYCALSVVDELKAYGFVETTPDENLEPGVEPVMVKDASVIALLIASGLVPLHYKIEGIIFARQENVPVMTLCDAFTLADSLEEEQLVNALNNGSKLVKMFKSMQVVTLDKAA